MVDEKTMETKDNRSGFALGVSNFSTSEPLLNAEKIVACGMDFIEPGLAKIYAMSSEDFEAAAQRIAGNKIRVQSVNWFLPPEIKVTGPDVDESKCRQFLECALSRAVKLGAKAVVFGSPGSRSLPENFSESEGRRQMVSFCRLCSDVIQEHHWPIRIAVEHVNHTETNFVNTFAQALSIVREVDRPEIGLAADLYHFAMENESMELMSEAGDLICAVQLANPNGRCFPKPGDSIPGLEEFFRRLLEIGYEGGVSVEATVGDDLESDCRLAVERLKSCLDSLA
ncbi:sugar phosphate isomerase/epimerase family protein [Mariniblastus fucicola]|uniref:Inosose isomerase n=1 Tax=Mariniblastus fucicola TaxID=980251 RepID=A0A5B9PDF9_9BACT|nr:sugar phosphate isomerase/epimerase family protein [Mariniblastus fucicola]QEG21063.1 Inosose isomerase [Mariniblastus fucicola]